MDLGLRGSVAVVVGASEGMGLASARALGREGAHVVVMARSGDRLEQAQLGLERDGIGAEAVIADAERPGELENAVGAVLQRHGRVDALVNAVGGWETAPSVIDHDDASWHFHLESVVLSAARSCRAVLPSMAARGSGAIVNIAAQSSSRHWSVLAPYSAMKAALVHLTKNLAREFGATGVRINAVRPGWIMSESQRRRISARTAPGVSDDEVFSSLAAEWPEIGWSGRFGTVEEVGDVVAFLASPRSGYVNGATLAIDGGSPT